MSYYHTCTICGANLDPCERCDCKQADEEREALKRNLKRLELNSNKRNTKERT